jgi:triacylglycerol lipase
MYFPNGFRKETAVMLSELILQSYAQFDAFESQGEWELSGNYRLKKELTYIWTPARAIERGIRRLDSTIRRLSRAGEPQAVTVPIGFIAEKAENTFIILRGTRTVNEWIRNFSINLSDYPASHHGKVHDGFLQTYNSMRKDIEDCLQGSRRKQKLFVGGHSLGAALATLALPDIELHMKRRVHALYTFGSPRVGDDAFAKAFNNRFETRCFRIANTSDIVTSIPLPVPLAGIMGGYFSHVDTPVDFTVQHEDQEKNHDMKTYLSALKESRAGKRFLGTLLTRSS